ncbi:MAG: ABC transporter, permease protein 2 (cluster 1, maltose/g3p/polyamine/iron), partial [uncultured Thermomicrobiales bacterium]
GGQHRIDHGPAPGAGRRADPHGGRPGPAKGAGLRATGALRGAAGPLGAVHVPLRLAGADLPQAAGGGVLAGADPRAVHPEELQRRLQVRARREVALEHDAGLDPGGRHRRLLQLAGGLRLRPAPLPGPPRALRAGHLDLHAAVGGALDPDVPDLERAGRGQHLLPPLGGQPVRVGLLRVHAAPVPVHDPAGPGGRGPAGRRELPADLLEHHAAADQAGAGRGGGLRVPGEVERLLRPADLPQRPQQVHDVARAGHVQVGLRHAVGALDGGLGDPDAADDRALLPGPALLHRGHRDHRPEGL